MLQPINFAPSAPSGRWAAPAAPGARTFVPAVPARTQPATAPPAPQPGPPRPIVRLQAEDETPPPGRPAPELRRTALALPSPEDLGIAAAPVSASPDWSAAHRRLSQLGAKCFHVDQLPNGGCRVICLLPTTESGKTHRVEAQAGSEAAALALALERVETWARRR